MKLTPGTAQQAGMSPERMAHLAELAAGWVAQGRTPALVVLVARKGIIVLHEAFGRLGPEPDAPPLRRDTLYPVASITKPITATAAMILVEEGRLGLNRPVPWYLPEFVGEGKQHVMVHHLLTHTAGLDDGQVDEYALTASAGSQQARALPAADETLHPTIREFLSSHYGAPLARTPGTEMSYSSYGYELLGEIVRRVSGQALADFCRERIFEPLGMADTTYVVPLQVQPRLVRRAGDAPSAEEIASHKLAEIPWAAAGVCSTAIDLAILGQMFLNRGAYGDARILSPATVAAMTRNQIPGISARFMDEFFPEASWGLGWSVRGHKKAVAYSGTLQSPATFSHGGAGGAFMWVDPVDEVMGVYLSVFADRELPPSVPISEETRVTLIGCMDLFMDAVTAAIVDP
jgi:CubicO group peptidase (beta-lactamase class C family)